MIGPSTEYIDERDNYAATKPIMDMLLREGGQIFPDLKQEYFIRNFAGIRPKLVPKSVGGFHDFVIERRDDVAPHAVNLVGIESPGLTSAVPIAHEVIRLMQEVETLQENENFDPIRHRIVTFHDKTPEEQAALFAEKRFRGILPLRPGSWMRSAASAVDCSEAPVVFLPSHS
jgi:glycerol-3-phosphate dehydrogenase